MTECTFKNGVQRNARLKRIYARIAQSIPDILPGCRSLYAPSGHDAMPPTLHWLASLGAIHHLDRMIALDIPWWNVAATAAIERYIMKRPAAQVFEYGSGASTVWLARRAAAVRTVEHDVEWAKKLGPKLSTFSNVTFLVEKLEPGSSGKDQPYVRSVHNPEKYDLIIIDGRLRTNCLVEAIPYLKPDGMIVFDDSRRRRYRAAIEGCGLSETRFHGLSYCVPYPDQTSILTTRTS